ncbi:MAG: hypothetical protein RL220_1126 [Bacteroidota bacterium]
MRNILHGIITSALFLAVSAMNAQSIQFDKDFAVAEENSGQVSFLIKISSAPATDVSVNLVAGGFATAVNGTDFVFESETVVFPAGSSQSQVITVQILDNAIDEADKLFTFELQNPVGATLGSKKQFVVFISDNELDSPEASSELGIEYVSSYLVDSDGSAEIVAYNKPQKRLYVMNSTSSVVEILDFSDPRNIVSINSIDLTVYGPSATSVACNNAIVAATVDGAEGEPGSVVFMNKNGVVLSVVQVGYLPDMLVFTPDNQKVLVANEGEPSQGYVTDPEGTISVIDISAGVDDLTQSDVITIDFHAFDDQIDELRAQGIRIFGLNSSVSQDLEPEYITVSEDSNTAWVTLQENNAVAVVDLNSNSVSNILPLGTKDHSLIENSLDVSDRNDSIHFATWDHLKGMFMPDAIASYEVDGITYLITANEGDQREYGVINEDNTVRSSSYVLDPATFPNATWLKLNWVLGRLAVSPYSGDTDGDGDFDEIHCFGARSFSIWNGSTGELVFDSGNDFETITATDPVFGGLFNASNNNNTFKNRSDNKGPEPEGVTVANIADNTYAFVTLERTGGFVAYNVTNPFAPVFESYNNSRDLGSAAGGDLGPEGIIYIPSSDSPSDTGLVVIANEISATLSVYNVSGDVKKKGNGGKKSGEYADADLILYPNPAGNEMVYFSKPVSFRLYDSMGKFITDAKNRAYFDVTSLNPGVYMLVTYSGETVRLVVE